MKVRKDYILSVAALLMAFMLLPAKQLDSSTEHKSAFALAGDGKIVLNDVESGESLSVTYRDGDGEYDSKALAKIDHLLRSHGSEDVHPISLKLVEFVDYTQDHFGAEEVRVASGYRSPEHNRELKRHLRRVANDSLHMQGMAMDILLPNVGKAELKKFAVAMNFGGIGKYRNSHFVHIDSGPVRNW